MDIINQAMFYLLNIFHSLTGSYGLAIIIVTVLIRVLLWPLNNSQTRSMKKMQELQPKIKALQEKYKNEPQKMQEAMMKFYAENKFNPFAGCLPMLVQIPIFIGLYGCLNSPQFMAAAGDESFLFIDKLYNTWQSHGGPPLDNTFNVEQNDKFQASNTATIVFRDPAKQPLEIAVPDPNNILTIKPMPLIPGEPVTFEIPINKLNLSSDYNQLADYVEIPVIDQNSREMEKVKLKPVNGILSESLKTVKGETVIHFDVLILIVVYALFTILYQKLMQKGSAQTVEGPQAQVMKLMPLMIVGMFFFIPIPAGALLYLLVTTALMAIQTGYVHWQDNQKKDPLKKPPSDRIIDIKPDNA